MGITTSSKINLTLLLLLITSSCISKKDNPIINDEIVLKIGSFEISRYEFENNKKRELERQTQGNTEDWLNKYIANSYFLADAYFEKYDTISAINKKVNYAAITMLGQFKGYLWNKVEEPKLFFSKKEIKEVYRKQNKLFDLEYLMFPDRITFNSILSNDTCINSEIDFIKVKSRCQTSSIKCINVQLFYPFNRLEPAKEQIYTSKQGNIIRIFLKDGRIFLAHIKKVSERKQRKFDEEKENISNILRRIKEDQIVADKRSSVFNDANIIINEDVADMIFKKVENARPPVGVSNTMLTDTILTYLFNKQLNALMVADFFDYYNNNPFMYAITNKKTLNEVLKTIVEEKYLYVESEKLGIPNEKKFILDKKDYMNRLILYAYSQNNFYAAKVADKDINDYYNANKKSYSLCKTCYVSVFTFKDKNSAYFNLNLVNKIISQGGIKNPSDTSKMGLLYYSSK